MLAVMKAAGAHRTTTGETLKTARAVARLALKVDLLPWLPYDAPTFGCSTRIDHKPVFGALLKLVIDCQAAAVGRLFRYLCSVLLNPGETVYNLSHLRITDVAIPHITLTWWTKV